MASQRTVSERKALGAFYTDNALVRVLVEWGLRRPGRAVMDPSCGDGRFLALAVKLGATRLVGCDVSPAAAETTRLNLAGAACTTEVVTSDFFALEPGTVEPVDVVVGNPPFIRYQRFNGESRRRALRSALRIGVRLSQLTSSWAPFLLHAVRFLRPGGDMAMVVPAEILQTNYGLATLRALLRRFASVSLYAFEENLFADAQEDTCLLLAEKLGGMCDQVWLVPLASTTDLAEGFTDGPPIGSPTVFPLAEANLVHFAEAFLRPGERRAWHQVRRHTAVRSLASLASVTNGYVSGDNEFFHRRLDDALASGYPLTWLFPVARSARSLQGLSFTHEDVKALEDRGVAHHLLVPQHDLFGSDPTLLERFVREGERRGTPRRYKCRVRDPWWRVPGLARGDVLVSYMAGSRPKAAVNRVGAFACNSLHGLKLNDTVPADLLVLGLHSSLALLSLEMEGRSYGGGVLKVEPRELDRVLVPYPEVRASRLRQWVSQVEPLLRGGRYDDAVTEVDRLVLERGLGLPRVTIAKIRAARERLVERRTNRSAKRQRGSRPVSSPAWSA